MPARSLALLALAAVTLASSLASAADLSRRQSEDYLSVSWGREGTIPRSTPHYTCDPFPFSINGTAEPFQIDTIEWPYPSDPKKQKVLSSRKRNGGWPGGDVEWTPKTKNGAELVLRITDGTGAVAYSSRRRMKNGGRDYGDGCHQTTWGENKIVILTFSVLSGVFFLILLMACCCAYCSAGSGSRAKHAPRVRASAPVAVDAGTSQPAKPPSYSSVLAVGAVWSCPNPVFLAVHPERRPV